MVYYFNIYIWIYLLHIPNIFYMKWETLMFFLVFERSGRQKIIQFDQTILSQMLNPTKKNFICYHLIIKQGVSSLLERLNEDLL